MLALELRDVTKTYSNGFQALTGVNLTVQTGDFFALLGANGAGKSTTISLISNLINKTSGEILIQGHSIDTSPQLAKLNLGVVPQELNLAVFETCEEVLLNVAGYYGISRAQAQSRMEHLLEKLSLSAYKKRIVYQLSGGMKRRLMIARSLMHQPKLLLLDEPSAGVDIEIRRNIWEFLQDINRQGTTIILTTHYLEEAEQLCNKIAIIHQGKIISQAATQELLTKQTYHTYILTTHRVLQAAPQLRSWHTQLIDQHSFEMIVPKEQSLNQIFAELLQQNIQIHSIHHKTNRLEALFMELIQHEH